MNPSTDAEPVRNPAPSALAQPSAPPKRTSARSTAWGASRWNIAARVTAALFGTLPLAWGLSALVAALLPLSSGWRPALLILLAFPAWVAAMSALFLVKSGARAWLVCAAGSALPYAILLLGLR